VARPRAEEYPHFAPEQAILSFLHLAVASKDLIEALRRRSITAIGYETIRTEDGSLPVLMPTSEVAGRLAAVIAGQLLTSPSGGRGMLLGGVPGVPPATVVIIGAGVLGLNACRSFLGMGAQVIMLDIQPDRLRRVDELFQGQASTLLAYPFNIEKSVTFADVVVLAVLSPGRRAPILVTRSMVKQMKPGSVLIDFSIDQGGSSETSRPTTLRDPVYREEGVLHYCVPYTPALVARTASYALTNASLPYLLAIGEDGLEKAISLRKDLAHGVNMFRGRLANPEVAASLGLRPEIELP
jgi:alanine dehydrogenase